MSYRDEEGLRRSARKQGLPIQPSPTSPQIDLLIDYNQMLMNHSSHTTSTHNEHPLMDIYRNDHHDDLLSFGSDADNESNDIGSSDNLLSSASSSPYTRTHHQYQPNTTYGNWRYANTIIPHIDPTVADLQNTIKQLNDRLGQLESSKPSPPSSPLQPPPPTPKSSSQSLKDPNTSSIIDEGNTDSSTKTCTLRKTHQKKV